MALVWCFVHVYFKGEGFVLFGFIVQKLGMLQKHCHLTEYSVRYFEIVLGAFVYCYEQHDNKTQKLQKKHNTTNENSAKRETLGKLFSLCFYGFICLWAVMALCSIRMG